MTYVVPRTPVNPITCPCNLTVSDSDVPHVASDDGSIFEWDSAMTYSLLLLSPLLYTFPL